MNKYINDFRNMMILWYSSQGASALNAIGN